jgi:hypothetical protein
MGGRRAIAASAMVVLALAAGPVGLAPSADAAGTLTVTPGTVELNGSVTISNGADGLCGADQDDPAAIVNVEISNPNDEGVADETFTPAPDGTWSYTFTGTDVVGLYYVFAYCGVDVTATTPVVKAVDIGYLTATFTVVEAPPTTGITIDDPKIPVPPQPVIVDPDFTG